LAEEAGRGTELEALASARSLTASLKKSIRSAGNGTKPGAARLRENRLQQARQWNLLSDMRPETLR
jgi:hypothetical protein